MMLPGPLTHPGEMSASATLVEGASTISNVSVISQPGSLDQDQG